jgi:hypothetical protein
MSLPDFHFDFFFFFFSPTYNQPSLAQLVLWLLLGRCTPAPASSPSPTTLANMSNYGSFGSFELNSIVRGAQLTLVGANRALRNPGLFTSEHYRQAALAVAAGIAIRILVAIPVCINAISSTPFTN